ncbi:PREDICTED: uncharacterized protein LOC104612134 isoform X2 [Nelumbo nucifera]|uniref:Uncharacterized protein LOC104612134 isoform X2 n=1 Tax=Nelumbo nucifera TaxID=4432 RepID=A0A1U8BLC6_NELNU|nr:PREDICTED: uncharacterized protein LOC104612134 isoform X2 [Nelumbo nucifera]
MHGGRRYYNSALQFVEDQVESVGVSVKKFCAEVMQDLHPPSTEDPVKGGNDLDMKQNADDEIHSKSKEDSLKDPIREKQSVLKELMTLKKLDDVSLEDPKMERQSAPKEESVVVALEGKGLSHTSLFDGNCDVNPLPPQSSVDPIKRADAGWSFEQGNNDDVAMCKKSSIGIIENPVKESQSEVIASLGDLSGMSLFSRVANENHEKACGMLTEPSSVEIARHNSASKAIHIDSSDVTWHCPDISNAPSSDLSFPVISCQKDLADIVPIPSRRILLVESNGNSGGQSVDVAEENSVTDPGTEMDTAFDNRRLDESCVVVDSNEICFVSPRASKHRSYKKKICDAFASKMRSGKKKEYEQLAICYEDHTPTNQQRAECSTLSNLTRDLDLKTLPSTDLCDSEWELL